MAGAAAEGRELRAALIGFGLGGAVFHAPLIAATPGIRVATIVTANPERAERARREHPEARVASTVEAVWERAGEHDFVVIAAANEAHVPLAEAAIEAALACVVDKPLAPSADAARALVERAEAAGVPLTAFHNRRWDSGLLTLRRLLDAGDLGEVHRFESRIERWKPELPASDWRFAVSRERGGGILLDLGTHLVDQALSVFGPVAELHAEVANRRGVAAEDEAFLSLRHESGVRSHLWVSGLTAAPGAHLRVLGSAGAFVVEAVDGQEDALVAGKRPDQGEWGAEPPERWGRLVRGESSEPVPAEPGDWPRFYRELGAALRGEGELPVDPRDAVAVLEVLERAAAVAEAASDDARIRTGR